MYDTLGSNRVNCFLGEPTRRRPVLPRPAWPRLPAVRCPPAIRPWYFRVLDSTRVLSYAMKKTYLYFWRFYKRYFQKLF